MNSEFAPSDRDATVTGDSARNVRTAGHVERDTDDNETATIDRAQAKIYRAEENLPQLYRLLYAYASVVLDTMAEHGEWEDRRHGERVRREKTRCEEALKEMEVLKPMIDTEAEAYRARATAVASSAEAQKARVAAAVEGRVETERNVGASTGTKTSTRVSLGTGMISDAAGSRHSLFGANLPSASATELAARSAAAHPTGKTNASSVGEAAPSAPGVPSTRHAHSLLPPPPPPPPNEDGVPFPEGIMYNASSVDFQPKVVVQVPSTDEAATDHTRLDTRLKLYNLREKVVRGDGNCQFRAIADQLFRDQERHAECRVVVINQLRRRAEDYSPYVPEDYDAYVEAMRKDGCWGDHITLQAAADAYGVRMCVISSYKDNFIVEIQPREQRSSRVCWISFWAEVHYNSLYGT